MSSYALIAVSDPFTAQTFHAAVRDTGLSAVLVRDGRVALTTILERGAPALLIVDLGLPTLDGLGLIEGLRRGVAESKTKVVAVSSDRALRDRASEVRGRLGISAVLAQAASDDSVKRVIRRVVAGEDDCSRRLSNAPKLTFSDAEPPSIPPRTQKTNRP